MADSEIDYKRARELKEQSDERRLQPIYIQRFFENAFTFMEGNWSELSSLSGKIRNN